MYARVEAFGYCNRDRKRLDHKIARCEISVFTRVHYAARSIFKTSPRNSEVKIWKLKKCVYGLDDASRQWYTSICNFLVNHGMVTSKHDNCVFIYKKFGVLEGVICCHVDDFFWSGSDMFENTVIKPFKLRFKVGSEADESFMFLGIDVKSSRDHVCLSQKAYITAKLSVIDRNVKNPLEVIRSSIGKLQWVATQTRPDIAFRVSDLSMRYKFDTAQSISRINKLVRELQFEASLGLIIPRIEDLKTCAVSVYSDASLSNNCDGSTQGGFIIFLSNGRSSAPLLWQSRKLRRIAHSTLTAETLALCDAIDAGICLRDMIKELCEVNLPIRCFTDNQSLVDSIKSLKNPQERRLRTDIASIRESVSCDNLEVIHVDTSRQLADCLTKNSKMAAQKLKNIVLKT